MTIPAWDGNVLLAVATMTRLAPSGGRWGTTLNGFDLGIAALAAVLRNMGGPAPFCDVEAAISLTAIPGLMRPEFDRREARMWVDAIGLDNMRMTIVIPWGEVVRRATIEHLLVVDDDGRWRAGPDANDAPSGALDARALVALSRLAFERKVLEGAR